VNSVTVDAYDLRIAGALMLGAGVVLPFLPDGVGVPCPLRTLTGVPCPLCGMTTSVVATLQLDLGEALAANPAGVAAVAAAIVLLVLRPRYVRIPPLIIYPALLLMWAFELHRFSIV
jgi:hypothetical protein